MSEDAAAEAEVEQEEQGEEEESTEVKSENTGAEERADAVAEEEDSDVATATQGMRNLSAGKDDLRSQVSADHVGLMNSAIERLCKRAPANLGQIPRAGETAAVEAYLRIVRRAISDGEDDNQIREKLSTAGVQEEQAKAAVACLNSRREEIRAHMTEAASQLSGKHLSDFDWKANVTLASSTASSLQIPSLQLALYLGDSNGGLEEVLMELDKERLDALIAAVSSARAAIARIPH